MVSTLKDYAIKALVNTVDHLGSATYKVNDLLDEKVDEVSGTETCVSSIEQVHIASLAIRGMLCGRWFCMYFSWIQIRFSVTHNSY